MFFEEPAKTSLELNKHMIQCINNGLTREVEQMLQERIVDPNFTENKQEHPLLVAADRNDVKMMEILIQHGADVNQCVTASGKSRLLMLADYYKNEQMAMLVNDACISSVVQIAYKN